MKERVMVVLICVRCYGAFPSFFPPPFPNTYAHPQTPRTPPRPPVPFEAPCCPVAFSFRVDLQSGLECRGGCKGKGDPSEMRDPRHHRTRWTYVAWRAWSCTLLLRVPSPASASSTYSNEGGSSQHPQQHITFPYSTRRRRQGRGCR